MGGRFGGPIAVPRTYKPLFEIRREAEKMAQRMSIPQCRSCGVHCSVCAAGGMYSKCCLSYPDTGESGETYDIEYAVKREKQT